MVHATAEKHFAPVSWMAFCKHSLFGPCKSYCCMSHMWGGFQKWMGFWLYTATVAQ